MTITIGRVGYDVVLNDPSDYSIDGDVLTLGGNFRITSVTDYKTLRQQMNGLVDNPWERWVPVTWSLDSTQDGFYRVISTSVDASSISYRSGFASYQVQLERVRSYSSAITESVIAGAVRSGKPGGVTAMTWWAIPSAASYVSTSILAAGSRVSASGAVNVYDDATLYYNVRPTFRLAPAHWYDMAATIKVAGVAVVGRQVGTSTTVEVSNGILKLSLAPGTWTMTAPTGIGAAYGTPIAWSPIQGFTAGPTPFSGTQTGWCVVRNTPEEVVVRCFFEDISTQYGQFTMDVGLRRGSAFATIIFSSATTYTNTFGVNVADTNTSITGGFRGTSADANGNRIVVASAKTVTKDLTNGWLYLTVDANFHDLMIGYELQGASATAKNAATDLRDQFYAAISETQSVRTA